MRLLTNPPGILVGLLALATGSAAFGQDLPADMRPFVKLGYEVSVEIYRGPTVRDGQVVDPGTLVDGPRRRIVTLGSGTVITRDGLILTNFHVYEQVTKPVVELDRRRNLLIKGTPLGRHMLVFENDPVDPLKEPELRYRAIPLSQDDRLDIALLKVVATADGTQRLSRQDFAFAELGNPYGIPWQRRLTLVGYPGKGGETVTVTEGKFLGYTRGVRFVTDGAIKTDGTIAGGSSGGSALYDKKLVGLPTQVSLKAEKGMDFGYIHPATWGLGTLAFVRLRYGQPIPEIDRKWLESEHNTDTTRTHLFLGGKIVAAESARPLEGVEVVVHRADRTFEHIIALDREVQTIEAVVTVKRLLAGGLTPGQVAERLKLRPDVVQDLMKVPVNEATISADARRHLDGEFFYAVDRSRQDGFFFSTAPRTQPFKVVLTRDGYRPRVLSAGPFPDRLYVTGDVIMLYQSGQ
jgi:hypothetical protein